MRTLRQSWGNGDGSRWAVSSRVYKISEARPCQFKELPGVMVRKRIDDCMKRQVDTRFAASAPLLYDGGCEGAPEYRRWLFRIAEIA